MFQSISPAAHTPRHRPCRTGLGRNQWRQCRFETGEEKTDPEKNGPRHRFFFAINKLKRWEIKKGNGKAMKASLRLSKSPVAGAASLLLEALLA
jgi:hypothetical protein